MKKTKNKIIQSLCSLRNSSLYGLVFLSTGCLLGKKKEVVMVPSSQSEPLSGANKCFDGKDGKDGTESAAALEEKNVNNDSITDKNSVPSIESNQATKSAVNQPLQKTTPNLKDQTSHPAGKRGKVTGAKRKSNVLDDTTNLTSSKKSRVKFPPNDNQEQLVDGSNNDDILGENSDSIDNNNLSNEHSSLRELELTKVKNQITLLEGLLKKLEKSKKFSHKTLKKNDKQRYKEITKYCNQSPTVLKNLHTKLQSLTGTAVNEEQLSDKEKLKEGFISSHSPVVDSHIEFLNSLISSIEQ